MTSTNDPLAQLQRDFPWIPFSECGPGWAGLLRDLALQIEDIVGRDVLLSSHAPSLKISQIKEKWGGLSCYWSPGPLLTGSQVAAIDAAVRAAEAAAETTCELCGAAGFVRAGSWLATLCDEHAQGAKPVGPRSSLSTRSCVRIVGRGGRSDV